MSRLIPTILGPPLRAMGLLDRAQDAHRNWNYWREYRRWKNHPASRSAPPHFHKRVILREFAARYRLRSFIETGTYLGDMVEAMRRNFDRVISIELSEDLARRARSRFAGVSNVEIIAGDSGLLLPSILTRLTMPALFWLDGHYSGSVTAKGATDTPIMKELEAIWTQSELNHVVLIDDARCFGAGDYPSLTSVQQLVQEHRPSWSFNVADDVIRIAPSAP